MQVNLYATFRLLAGQKSLDIHLPPEATVMDALRAVVDCYPVLRAHWLDSDGVVFPHVHIFINDQEISTLPAGLDTRLNPTDRLDFFPPVAGG